MFSNLKVRNFLFKNRIVLASLTRCRCDPVNGLPNDLVKEYYVQRSESSALIVGEAMPVNDHCNPWPGAGGLWNDESIPLWNSIVESVHKQNTLMFAQFFHGGRLVHPDLVGGRRPISASDIKLSGMAFVPTGQKPYETPESMTHEQIKQVIADFSRSFQNAKKAGFDGVEIGAGSGLLLDQFLQTQSNHRTDEYGGSVEGRCRFTLEIVDEALKTWDADQIGIKLCFVGRAFDMYSENPHETMAYLLPELDRRGILYVNIVEAEDYVAENNGSLQIENSAREARKYWKRTLITNGYRSVEERTRKIVEGEADLVAFGRTFISNPDLTERLKNNWPLTQPKQESFYFGGATGYTDYPRHSTSEKS
jgi:N-ethylmaleimide reductase